MNAKRYSLWLVGLIVCLAGCGSGGGGNISPAATTGSTITGRALDAAGSPVSGAQVSLMTSGNQPQQTIATAITSGNGGFTLTNLAAGTYIISVSDVTSSGTMQTVLVTVTVSAGATASVSVDLSTTVNPNSQTGAVFGKVTMASDIGVQGLTVTLQSHSNAALPALTTTTDSAGNYSFTSVASGIWLVSVKGRPYSTPIPVLTTVQPGAATQVDFIVAPTGGAG